MIWDRFMKLSPFSAPFKTFLLGLSISVLILVSFFGGAVADRMFVIKPLDYMLGKRNLANLNQTWSSQSTLLGSLLSPTGRTQSDVADVAEAASPSVVTVSIKTERQVIDS